MNRQRRLALAALAALALPARAESGAIEIVTSDDGLSASQIRADLEKRLPGLQGHQPLAIAIGPGALHQLIEKRYTGHVLAAYCSAQVWRALVHTLPAAQAARWSAVYADPAPADQLRLAARVLPQPAKLAVILGPDTAFLRPMLQNACPPSLQLQVIELSQERGLNAAIDKVARAAGLLALPDQSVFNPDSIRTVLLSTYRHNQAVIGFSADMVTVGAIATTCSSVEETNAQVAEIAHAFAGGAALPPPVFPRYFHTVLNPTVARGLGIALAPDLANLARSPS